MLFTGQSDGIGKMVTKNLCTLEAIGWGPYSRQRTLFFPKRTYLGWWIVFLNVSKGGGNFKKKKSLGKPSLFYAQSRQCVNKSTKKNYGVVQHYLLGDSIIHCKCVNGMLYWLHFNAGILKMIFLYSFRGVGAMEIVAMDMKVRSIVF